MTKKRDSLAKLLFCFFAVLVAVAVVVEKLLVFSRGNQWWRLEMSVIVFSQATMESNGGAVLRNVASAMASQPF